MKSIINFIKTRYIISSVLAIVLIALLYFVVASFASNSKIETTKPTIKKIVQGVSVTGRVKPSSDVDLAFERPGTVARIYADVGTEVKAGDLIVALQSADVSADLAQAKAQLLKEQVKLDDLKSGNRPEDITISQSQLDNAKTVLASADTSAINAIQDAYSKVDDAIRYRIDKFFDNPRTPYPTLVFTVEDSGLAKTLQENRADLEDVLDTFAKQSQKLSATSDITGALNTSVTYLNKIKSFADNLSIGVNNLTSDSSVSQTTIDEYKSNMSAARTSIALAVSGITTAINTRSSAVSGLITAQSQFDLKKAGNTSSDINAQLAQVEAQASLVSIKEATLSKNFLRSPIDGVVSKQDAKVGQIVQSGVVVVSVISNTKFQIEADIPEASISKVNVGNPATVSLDAYPDITFDASIIKIDPAETMVDGVPTYKITFQFNNTDDRIRSGMTANVEITSAEKDNALVVSQRVVYSDTQGNYVYIMEGGKKKEVRVKTGIKGSDGNVEIVQGLSENDLVVVPTQ